jgi:hypothetical protein
MQEDVVHSVGILPTHEMWRGTSRRSDTTNELQATEPLALRWQSRLTDPQALRLQGRHPT